MISPFTKTSYTHLEFTSQKQNKEIIVQHMNCADTPFKGLDGVGRTKQKGGDFVSATFMRGKKNKCWWQKYERDHPQATNLFLVVELLFVAVSACDWYPMITFGGTPNLSL